MSEPTQPPKSPALRIKAIETLMIERDLLDPKVVDEMIEIFEHRVGPRNGAKVVAKAWADSTYRERLLKDGTAAIAELGYTGGQGEHMVVLENTLSVHNVCVCTLCSCYPWPTLGLPPTWYKTAAYRSRIVAEPRAVLAEFGLSLPDSIEVRVWDSNAEIRYLVLPMRPRGTEGWSEERLLELVTRDSMIGTGLPKTPD
ncbi:MAG TPA: nitrile hydratase subunit alpha [Burkholderiaceae bacterium]|nr:nitrile hydratase subunit alpha [Burkholderiaceae bacterium]